MQYNYTIIEGSDYLNEGVQTMVFNSYITQYTVNIPILNDDTFELNEDFQVILRFAHSVPSGVSISPAKASITIVDDDSELKSNENILILC